MNKGRRLVAGAAAACALVTPAAALADSNPAPTGPPGGVAPADPTNTATLPDGLADCLTRNGFPVPPAGTQLPVPATPGAPPTSFTGTIPLPGGTIPLPGLGAPPATGTTPLSGGAASTAGEQCGQIIINNTIYLVTVTLTTTTTSANGPIAAGPVTLTSGPAAPLGTGTTPGTTPAATRTHATHRPAARLHSTAWNRSIRRKAPRATAQGSRALRVVLVRTGRGSRAS
jgi:hypothetical protein